MSSHGLGRHIDRFRTLVLYAKRGGMKNENQIPNKRLQGKFPSFLSLERSSPRSVSPDLVKMVIETDSEHNERKFQYLDKQQAYEAETRRRADALKEQEHNFKRDRHADQLILLKPVIWTILLTIFGSTVAGIWLCWIGKEAIGAAILSGIWGAVFGYLGGLGTSNFFKNNS